MRDKRVIQLTIGGEGPNVLGYIDIESPMAETQLRSVIGRIVGPVDDRDGKDSRFKKWGRTIILALAAHMMWDPDIPPELKTLRAVRAGLDVGEARIRDILRGIAESSHSPMARSLAGSMHSLVPDTFSGCYANATEDTEWLASAAYSNLVSGQAYPITDLVKRDLVVFVQVPQESLEHTPAVARVLTGCHLDAVFASRGQVNGRVFFPIDEAVLLGRDPALKIARDQGRKGRVSLQLFYPSEGQIEDVWGRAGTRAWFDGLSWRTYAGVQLSAHPPASRS
jgi:type IV secretion system protein VirD4